MPKDNTLYVEKFEALEIPKKDLGRLEQGVWIVNSKSCRELVFSFSEEEYFLTTIQDFSGHVKIIGEHLYKGTDSSSDSVIFKRVKTDRFPEDNSGYESRMQLMEKQGYNRNKFLGGFQD